MLLLKVGSDLSLETEYWDKWSYQTKKVLSNNFTKELCFCDLWSSLIPRMKFKNRRRIDEYVQK